MRNWWKSLSEPKKAWLLLVIVMMGLFLGLLVFTYEQTTDGRIIFDSAKQEIRQELSFTAWLFDWLGPEDRYVLIPKKIELVNIEMNFAFKARFQMPRNPKAIQNYIVGSVSYYQIQQDLTEGIGSCIRAMTRHGLEVKGFPFEMAIRAISIYKMDELCPITNNHGYQWDGSLELVQCNGDIPLDNAQKNDCLNSARMAHYP